MAQSIDGLQNNDVLQEADKIHNIDVIIIGAGISGVGFAIKLVREFGTRSFKLIEKSDNIGGTWWVNSYPGCGCDVSFVFMLPLSKHH